MSDKPTPFDPTKPCATRDGRQVRIYATDAGGAYPIQGAILMPDGTWGLDVWAIDGMCWEDVDGVESASNLVNTVKRVDVVRWLVITRASPNRCAAFTCEGLARAYVCEVPGTVVVRVTGSYEA